MTSMTWRESLCLLIGLGALCSIPLLALSHEAPTGWRYDGYCCGGQDCEPIPSEWVSISPEGYTVRIPANGHKISAPALERTFPFEGIHRSGDEHYHACVLPYSKSLRCLYVPDWTG